MQGPYIWERILEVFIRPHFTAEVREAKHMMLNPVRAISSICTEVDSSWLGLLVIITRISLAGICLVTGPC